MVVLKTIDGQSCQTADVVAVACGSDFNQSISKGEVQLLLGGFCVSTRKDAYLFSGEDEVPRYLSEFVSAHANN
jgi:hypothetical protein